MFTHFGGGFGKRRCTHYDKQWDEWYDISLAVHAKALINYGYFSCYARFTMQWGKEKMTLQVPRLRIKAVPCR